MELYLTNVEDKTVMYVFFALGFVAATALGLVVHWGNEEREYRAKLEEKEAARKRAEYVACVRVLGACTPATPRG